MIRAGIAALGRWGRRLVDSVQGEGVAPSPHIRFTCAWNRTPAHAREYAASRGLRLVDSYAGLLADPDIDVVVLATPHSGHPDEIVQAAAAGRPVFCEKPLALARTDAARAAAACADAGVALAAGHNRRFLPAYAELTRRLRDGALGQPLHVEGNFSGSFGFDYDDKVWRADPRETPAGGLTLMGIHVIDAMIGLLGPVERVAAQSTRQVLRIPLDDTTGAMLRFASGATGYVSTLTATARLWRLQLFGTRGWAHMLDHHLLEIGMIGAPVERIEFPQVDAERLELEAFARTVVRYEPYPVPIADVLEGIGTLEAFASSACRDGEWTEVLRGTQDAPGRAGGTL
jgi:myo-inositol 2-dehydrogenase/D-chiro-inositol 1-dehydrogenase